MAFQATTGLGVAAKILVAGNQSGNTKPGYNNVTLSLSGTGEAETFQLNPQIVDVAGNPVTLGTQFTLTSVASSSGNTAVYTGTITGGGSNAFAGQTFVVAGFVATAANNGTFICTASSTTTLTLENANAAAETHAATATDQESTNNLTYVVYPAKTLTGNTYKPSGTSTAVVTVSADGLLTSVAEGGAVVEVSFPTFNNASGTTGAASGNPMYNLPLNKIYAEINVTVVA